MALLQAAMRGQNIDRTYIHTYTHTPAALPCIIRSKLHNGVRRSGRAKAVSIRCIVLILHAAPPNHVIATSLKYTRVRKCQSHVRPAVRTHTRRRKLDHLVDAPPLFYCSLQSVTSWVVPGGFLTHSRLGSNVQDCAQAARHSSSKFDLYQRLLASGKSRPRNSLETIGKHRACTRDTDPVDSVNKCKEAQGLT
ncbi:LAQU0S11e01860g1_1 [Lachancea quebecensis]|uniref:LAQU0S11e01860g1_1 n=1 Tax=Lachancea quebecensis TaxID=1654605 RepID=A0A0P1KTV6_9SACH|nr:LAQU0S11e01860g1_1 [Lachancea quebecensis]